MATIASAASATATATVTLTDWWLKNPATPAQNLLIDVPAPFQTTRTDDEGVFRPLGRTRPVVVTDAAQGDDGTLTVETWTQAEWVALKALTGAAATLLLQSPLGEQWYIFVAGGVTQSILFADGTTNARTVSIPYVEVDAP